MVGGPPRAGDLCRVDGARGSGLRTSGGLPIFGSSLRLGELVATLALAQDNCFGQPLESQLRSCLLSVWLCEELDRGRELRDTAYWASLLRYLGCTGHAHEVAAVFGDEIAVRARTLVHDAADPAEVMRDVVELATAGRAPEERDRIIRTLQETAQGWAVHNFASGCEVGDRLAVRLGFGADVRDALAFTFERWNGNGYPHGARGEAIPLAMRVVHLAHDMEAIGRLFTPEAALAAAADRRDRTYDPLLVDVLLAHGATWFDRLGKLDPWDAVLALEPEPARTLTGDELDDVLLTVADFIDLKSPYLAGHSRRCADLALDAGRLLALDDDTLARLRRAALVHEIGTTAVPNSILDKPGPLTRSEFDRVELHPMLSEQMLRRTPMLAELAPVASAHHERADRTGYHKGLGAEEVDTAALVLAAVDLYVGLTTDRADRPAFSEAEAAARVAEHAERGALDKAVTSAVLRAAGHDGHRGPTRAGAPRPGGLTVREIEVLRLACRGLTLREVGDRLHISPKTADHHIQHIYTKIGVSTRAGAALWAVQHGVVGSR